jgi:hypothetical protein
MRTKGTLQTIESQVMSTAKPGDHFYTEKGDRHLTAIANYHKKRIKTERLIVVTTNTDNPIAWKITKVIILEPINP